MQPSADDELNQSFHAMNDDSLVPPIEAVIGHWFACGKVHIVFAESDGRQFFLMQEDHERAYGTFLKPGQHWNRRDEPTPLQGRARDEGILRAYHEAGHSVICIDEGLKVEYITIVPHLGWNDERRLGYCQYDYRLQQALKADGETWTERAAKAELGGPLADYMFRNRSGMNVPDGIRYAWRNDRRNASRHVAEQVARENKAVDLERDIDRLFEVVSARLHVPYVWAAVAMIAERLCDEGAISGEVAVELFEHAKKGTVGEGMESGSDAGAAGGP